MSIATLKFKGVNRSVLRQLKAKLKEEGISTPSGSSGTLEGKGVKATFHWDGKNLLVIDVTKKPIIASKNMIIDRITGFITEAGGQRA